MSSGTPIHTGLVSQSYTVTLVTGIFAFLQRILSEFPYTHPVRNVYRGPWPAVGAASPLPCEPSPVGFQCISSGFGTLDGLVLLAAVEMLVDSTARAVRASGDKSMRVETSSEKAPLIAANGFIPSPSKASIIAVVIAAAST